MKQAQGRLVNGFLSGVLATIPMTVFMLWANRTVPAKKPDPLPPEEITANVTRKANVEEQLSKPKHKGLTLAAHFNYGGAAAVPLGMLVQKPSSSAMGIGIAYGLAVWAGSYLGLMPALKLYPSAKDEPARMNIIMVLAHIIWGGAAGLFARRLNQALKT